jgi:hypothetical protein
LVEAELLKLDDVAWLERAEIHRILKEQELSLLFGAKAVSGRISVGRLLKADLLVMLEVAPADEQEFLRLVVSETASGLRLASASMTLGKDAQADVDAVVSLVRGAVAKHRSGITAIYTVPPFFSRNLTYEFDYLSEVCAGLVEQCLLAQPGSMIVELAEADAVAQELRLADTTATVRRPQPLYLIGEYRNLGGGEDPRIEIKFESKRSGHVIDSRAEAFPLPELAARLRQATVQLIERQEGNPPVSDPAAEARQLAARADEFTKIGQFGQAWPLYEAALLLRPEQAQVRFAAIGAARRLYVPVRDTSPVNDIVRTQRMRRRIVEHLQALLQMDADVLQISEVAKSVYAVNGVIPLLLEGLDVPESVRDEERSFVAAGEKTLLEIADRLAENTKFFNHSADLFRAAVKNMEPSRRYQETIRVLTRLCHAHSADRLLELYVRGGHWNYSNSLEIRQFYRELIASKDASEELVASARQKLAALDAIGLRSVPREPRRRGGRARGIPRGFAVRCSPLGVPEFRRRPGQPRRDPCASRRSALRS